MSEEQSRRALDVAHSGDPLTSDDYAKMGIPEPPITEVTEEALLSGGLGVLPNEEELDKAPRRLHQASHTMAGWIRCPACQKQCQPERASPKPAPTPVPPDVQRQLDAILGGEQLLQLRDLPPATGEPVEGERRGDAQCDGEAHEHRHRHLQAVVR